MKRLIALIAAALMLLPMGISAATKLDIPTIEYEGKTYYDLGSKDDYFKAARYGIENRLTAVSVFIDYAKLPDYKSNNIWYCDVRNFNYTKERLYFSYYEYSTNTVCMTGYYHDFENDREYGDIEITYIDSADELAKGDKMVNAQLSKISSYSKADKIKYIAEYICKNVQPGSKEMPGGGYDDINGVYDLMTGNFTNVVCSSYAFLFQRFMELSGYKSYIATGRNHAWNVVELDGKWYGVDCTYGDEGSYMNSKYLLMGMDKLQGYTSSSENVFAQLEKDKGCKFSSTAYGSSASTGNTGNNTTTPSKPVSSANSSKPTASSGTSKPTTSTNGDKTNSATSNNNKPEVSKDTVTTGENGSDNTQTENVNSVSQPSNEIVDVTENADVALNILDNIVQNGGTLILQGESYSWSFKGNKLTEYDASATFNTAIHLGNEVSDQDISTLEKINKKENYFPFSFEHHGALPGEAEICINVSKNFADKKVDIYSIDNDGNAVFEGTAKVTADGKLTFSTNHCSLWFIKETASKGLSIGIIWLIVGLSLAVSAAVGVGVYFFIRKKKNVSLL